MKVVRGREVVNKKKTTGLRRKRQRITEQSEELQTMRIYQR
jgi:hypothetical protein